MNWLDALARRMGCETPTKTRKFRPSLETLDQRVVPALVAATSSIGGFVYCDANNNGVKEAGEAGISGVTINLTGTDAWGQPVNLSTTTGADGAYSFTQDTYGAAILPGTYTVTEVQPAGDTDGKDTQGTPASGTVGNDTFINVNLGTQGAGVNAVNYNFGEVCPPPKGASIGGYVYCDANNNGVKDAGEAGIAGVTVTLTGTTALGTVTPRTATTDATGKYQFNDLLAGTYTIKETQPGGYTDGKDTQGTPGTGTTGNDIFSNIILSTGTNGADNNFGEICPTPTTPVGHGDTATIGFWQNKNGQALIKSLNGGPNSTALGNWLSSNFPNLFGAGGLVSNTAGKSNTSIANLFTTVFAGDAPKTEAQIMATALAVYVTDSDLAGTAATKYGFNVSSSGTGAKTYNVRSYGTAIGLSNNTSYSVFDLLKQADLKVGSGSFDRLAFNNIFDGINQMGDII